jgi:hypothetical protein
MSQFQELPAELRPVAQMWLERIIARRLAKGQAVTGGVTGILYGRAKSLALKPRDSDWGRRMLARRGGLATQRRYRQEGRNPTAAAVRAQQARREAGLIVVVGSWAEFTATPQKLAEQIANRLESALRADGRFQNPGLAGNPIRGHYEIKFWAFPAMTTVWGGAAQFGENSTARCVW